MLRESRGAITAFALVVCAVLLVISLDLGLPGEHALQSLRFHIAAALVVLVVLLFLLGAWWRGLLFLIVVGLSAGQGAQVLYRQQQLRAGLENSQPHPLLKLVSFNLLNPNQNGAEIADFLVNAKADVVYLMEARPIGSHLAQLATAYPFRAGCESAMTCDLVILSRTPLEDVQFRSLSRAWNNRLATAKTTIDGQTINLAAVHMVKPYFDEFAEDEAETLVKSLRDMAGPVLVAGDFNAAAWSDNIDWLVRTAGLTPAPFYPATWPIRLGPLGVPIDNVFTRAPLVVSDVRSMDDAFGSNHRGLIANISIAP